ncbi:MAG: DUF3237 family protein [Planctomycetes bacterium]|nr:DUF3237 family protein [Planctomycetota bacterium]
MGAFGEGAELLYEYAVRLGPAVEYGASMAAVVGGEAPPACGLRVDIPFEGEVRGRLGGHLRGIDYLTIRADGRMELDLRGCITTPDGKRIALRADGVGLPTPDESLVRLRENVTLTTADPDLAWLNAQQVWATGEANLATGEVRIRGYLA